MRLHRHRWLIAAASAAQERKHESSTVGGDATIVLRLCDRPDCSETRTDLIPGKWCLSDLTARDSGT